MKKKNNQDLKENLLEDIEITEEEIQKYGQPLKCKVIESLVKYGLIDINEMNDSEILTKVIKVIEDIDFKLVLNYKDSILNEARRFYNEDNLELSCLLYATWFEHWINEKHLMKLLRKVYLALMKVIN